MLALLWAGASLILNTGLRSLNLILRPVVSRSSFILGIETDLQIKVYTEVQYICKTKKNENFYSWNRDEMQPTTSLTPRETPRGLLIVIWKPQPQSVGWKPFTMSREKGEVVTDGFYNNHPELDTGWLEGQMPRADRKETRDLGKHGLGMFWSRHQGCGSWGRLRHPFKRLL